MAWMFKRSSVCFPGQNNVVSGVTKCSSFALSPSVHRDLQQADSRVDQITPGYYCTLPRNMAKRRNNMALSRNSSMDGSMDEICQFSQTTTLTLPLSQSSRGVTMCFDASTSSISSSVLPTLAAPPQFADSPPDEKKTVKVEDNLTRF